MCQPKFFIPIYGDYTSKRQHIEIAVEEGIPRKKTLNADNGEVIEFSKDQMSVTGKVPTGIVLVDQTGATVSNVVIKDRLLLAEEGLVTVVLTIDRKNGTTLTSPDIISRGFIYMRDNEELMTGLRNELRRAVTQRFKRIELDRFKQEIKEHVTHYLYEQTNRSPIVIPVVNVINGRAAAGGKTQGNDKKAQNSKLPTEKKSKEPTSEEIAAEQQKRFDEMRAKLLGQDARTD